MSLRGLAQATLTILERGEYTTNAGQRVDVSARIAAAVQGTRLYAPGEYDALRTNAARPQPPPPAAPPVPRTEVPRIEVTDETTAAAARRVVGEAPADCGSDVVALNYASAKNPGGGFLTGAKAQEEDLARCSALYACLLTQRAYYDANRAAGSMIYTDHIIYSPRVPFFRDERLELLPAPFDLSIVTAPAPNAGEAQKTGHSRAEIRAALIARAGHVLTVMAAHGHRTLVLGAWGCGVFRNDSAEVADAWAYWLAAPEFASAFDRVVFAVYDRGAGQPNLTAFRRRFGA
jgi:uncharacterized protein (TIGR02452 family)